MLFLLSGVAVTDAVEVPAGAGDDDIRNLNEIARIFDVSLPTVRRWIDDGCPVRQVGGNGVPYMLSAREVARWRGDVAAQEVAERERKAQADNQLRLELGTDGLSDIGAETAGGGSARRQAIQIEYERVRLAKELRTLIPYAEVETALAVAIQTFRAGLGTAAEEVGEELGLDDDVILSIRSLLTARLSDLSEAFEKLLSVARGEAG